MPRQPACCTLRKIEGCASPGSGYNYYVELEKVSGIDGVEQALRVRLDGKEDPTVSLHCDKTVAVDEVVKVMNIAKDRNYKLILATQP